MVVNGTTTLERFTTTSRTSIAETAAPASLAAAREGLVVEHVVDVSVQLVDGPERFVEISPTGQHEILLWCADLWTTAARTHFARRPLCDDVARGVRDPPAAGPTIRFELGPRIKHATGRVKGPEAILPAT